MTKLVLEGIITCIHHISASTAHAYASGLNLHWKGKGENLQVTTEEIGYSAIDVKVGRREMRIVRPMTPRFELPHKKGAIVVKSGDKIRITLETLEDSK